MTLEIGNIQYVPLGKYVPGSGSGGGPVPENIMTLDTDQVVTGPKMFVDDTLRIGNSEGNYSVLATLDTDWHYTNPEHTSGFTNSISFGTAVIGSIFQSYVYIKPSGELDVLYSPVTSLKDLEELNEKIKDLQLFKFPNATIQGDPVINNGQVSNFTDVDYLQFPFILDLHNKPFRIEFPFTTDEDVTTQQNILDSRFGIALAIKDGKGLMAISSNGTSWDIGNTTGTFDIQPHTTYYAKVSWDGILYKTELSVDEQSYVTDMHLTGNLKPYPTTIYIGGCNSEETGHDPHPFFGIINMNKARMFVQDQLIWQGMDDVGLATRLDRDADNITETGIRNLKRVLGLTDIEIILDEILGDAEAVTNLVYDINGEVIEQ